MPISIMKRYGRSTDTRKCRCCVTVRWWKMIAMALSITVKAVELKKTSTSTPTIPTTSRCAKKVSTCSVTDAA